jgi:hypothetical protein
VKQTILDVLEDMSKKDQINLGSEGARKVVSNILVAALKEKGEYKKYTNDELEEQEAREYWVCEICKKSSYDLDWDYIGSGTNHLSCEVRLELDEEKMKRESILNGDEVAKALGHMDKDGNYITEPEKSWYEDVGDGTLLKVDDLERMKMKLSEEIVDDKDEKYIYESPDGGETIFKRKVGSDKRELVKNWEKVSR